VSPGAASQLTPHSHSYETCLSTLLKWQEQPLYIPLLAGGNLPPGDLEIFNA
jgi:hypothetical protein